MFSQTEYDLETRSGRCACPACTDTIELSDVMENEIVECETCAGEFEVLNLDPFEIVEVEDDEEDWGE